MNERKSYLSNQRMKGFIATVLVICASSGFAQTTNRPALTGRVISPQGISPAATVLILYARAKPELEVPGLDHYPQFPRRAMTDGQGNFKIESLDPAWLYHGVIVAPGCRAQNFDGVDPAAGPLNVRLEAASSTNAPGTILHGRVVDAGDKPVAHALIRIGGVTRNRMTQWPADRIDPFAVTDDKGFFVVYGQTAFTAAEGSVEADGFATALFEGWVPGDAVHTLPLAEGSAFQGRLMQAGKPVVNVNMRLDNFGRESGSEIWNYSVFTDDQGRFLFRNLPPNRSFSLHATMQSLGGRGSLSKQPGEVHEIGSTNDIGDVSLKPAFKVEGRIRLTDGRPLPAHSRANLVRTSFVGLQDRLWLTLNQDGAFRFDGVPAETITIFLRIPGYEISPRDRELISGSATNFNVVTNVTGMVIQMQPESSR